MEGAAADTQGTIPAPAHRGTEGSCVKVSYTKIILLNTIIMTLGMSAKVDCYNCTRYADCLS